MLEPRARLRTRWYAPALAGGYLVVAAAYILVSGHLARALTHSADELEAIESFKGIGFVVVTGLGLFVLAAYVLRKLDEEHAAGSRACGLLVRSERTALAGLFVSSIVHDASNLGVVVTSALSELKDVPLDEDARGALADAQSAMGTLTRLFQDLKQMGRDRASTVRVVTDLRAQVERNVALLRGHSAMKRCRVTIDAPSALPLPVFPQLVDQVLINLLLNAADATQGRGGIEVRLHGGPAGVRLEVHDDGQGVPPELEAQLFTPFSTTKPHGTGLGLVSVQECARVHGGRAEYARSPLGGACFSVSFPTPAA